MKSKIVLNKVYKIFIVMMILIWSKITFTSIFNIYTNDSVSLSSLVILLGTFILLLLLVFIYRFIGKLSDKQHTKIAVIIFFLVFLLMYSWGLNNRLLPTYDLSHAISKVHEMLNNKAVFGFSSYFSIYPNQIPLTLFIYFIEHVGVLIGFSSPDDFMILYNAFMTSLTLLCVYFIIKKLFNSRLALIGLLLLAIYPDFYLFVPYYYTDILSLPFGIIGFLLIIDADKKFGIKGNLEYLLSGISFAIGFKLRVVILILLIAYILVKLFKEGLINVLRIAIVVLSMSATLMVYSLFVYPHFQVSLNESMKLPISHWIMMGLNEETSGRYTDTDAMYSLKSLNKNDDINRQILRRLRNINYDFIVNKLSLVWSSGNHDIVNKYATMEKYGFTHNFLNSKNRIILLYFEQILKVTIYILFLISLVYEFTLKNAFFKSRNSVIIVAVFGSIVFYLLWEALLRYSFSFLPWILIGSVPAISLLTKMFSINKITVDNKVVNIYSLKRVIAYVFMSLIVVVLIGGFIKYSIFRTRDVYTRAEQIITTNTYIPIIDNEIKEAFRVDKDFNFVQLKFDSTKVVDKVNYIYELYDKDNNLIVKDNLVIEEGEKPSKENPYPCKKYNLSFPLVGVNGMSEFYLKLYSKDASKNNYAAINYFKSDDFITDFDYYSPEYLDLNYDVFPMGETLINNEEVEESLYIKIAYQFKKPLINRYIYIVFAFIVILLSIMLIKNVLLDRRGNSFVNK